MNENKETRQGNTASGEFNLGRDFEADHPPNSQREVSMNSFDEEFSMPKARMRSSGQQKVSVDDIHQWSQSKGTGSMSGDTQRYIPPSQKRTGTALWLALMALAIALAGETWYGWLALQKHGIQLSQLPGVQETLSALGGRIGATEAKLGALAADWDGLVKRVTKLDRKFSSELQLARKQTQELIAQAQGHMQAELDKRTQVIDGRLSQVEFNQDAQREHLAQLQKQLEARVREEVASVRKDTGTDLASLHEQVDQSQGELHALARKLDRERVDFEATKNDTREIVHGISLRVTNTNVSYQRYAGYLWFLPDTRTLWLPNVGVQQPVVFYPKQGGQPYELVVTRVAKDSVVGYLLQPLGRSQDAVSKAAAQGTAGPPSGL